MNVIHPWFRLGVVAPHHTNMSIYQTYRTAPEGLLCYFTALDLKEYTLAGVEENLPRLWNLVDELKDKGSERIVLGGVPVAAALGRPKAREILEQVKERTGVPTGSSFEDHLQALEHLGAKRIAMANRWPEDLNIAVGEYLEDAGIELLGYHYGGRTLAENKKASPEADHDTAMRLGRAALREHPEAEALLLPGGNGFFLYAAPLLEEEFGVPVLTNTTSTLWAALNQYGGELPVKPDPRWGMLLQAR